MGLPSSCVSLSIPPSLSELHFVGKTKNAIVLPRGYGEGQGYGPMPRTTDATLKVS